MNRLNSMNSSASLSVKISEVEEFEQTHQLNQWTIPVIKSSKIYKTGTFDFIFQKNIKTVEQSIGLNQDENTLNMLSYKELSKYLNSKYKYLHVGCIQVAFKPLTLSGLNASIIACLRDARCLDFKQSLMGIAETSLCHGPVYFDVYPNRTLSLSDINLFESVSMYVRTQGYNFLPGSETISVIYRIHYKVLTTLCPKVIIRSEPGKTLVVDSNCLTTKVVVPRLINWDEINFPTTWMLPSVVPILPEINDKIDQISQTTDGDIEVSFAPNRVRKLSLSRSSSVRLPNTSYQVDIPSSRNSVSEINHSSREFSEENKIKGIRYSENQIPHGIYNSSLKAEEPRGTSPTASEMSFNMI